MVNEVILGISAEIYAAFGDGYEIYRDDVEQDLQEPCFFIAPLEVDGSTLPCKRIAQTVPVDLHYFPKDPASNTELFDVGDKLMDALEIIRPPEGVPMRGVGRRYEVVDGVLHFFVSFTTQRMKVSDAVLMERVNAAVNTKEG